MLAVIRLGKNQLIKTQEHNSNKKNYIIYRPKTKSFIDFKYLDIENLLYLGEYNIKIFEGYWRNMEP